MIRIKNALLKSNSHITSISNVETVKSLTEGTSFTIDFSVAAASKFSDFEYAVSLYYRKYDQGWFAENSSAIIQSSKLVRVPSNEEMIQIANNDKHLLYDWDSILPIDNGSIIGSVDFENEILTFSFIGVEPQRHANEITEYTSLWKYNMRDDTWVFEKYDDNQDFVNRKMYYEVTADFTGHWENGSYGAIDIVDFSAERMRISWEGLDSPMVFTLSVNPLEAMQDGASKDPKDYYQSWYAGENGYTLYMNYGGDHTWITIYKSVSMTKVDVAQFIDVKADLPMLN